MRILQIIFIYLISFFLVSPVYAIQDVILDIEGEGSELEVKKDDTENEEVELAEQFKTFREKIEAINSKEYNDISKSNYLLEDVLTKRFSETSAVKTLHLFAYYRANTSMDFYPDDSDLTYGFNDINVGVNGKLKDGKSYYEARLRFNHQNYYSFLQYMPSNMYIANASIPHHTIIVGNTRTATGHEGVKSSSVIPFVARSQISRNFGNIRKLGVRVKGKYDLVEYDFGGFSSDTYFRKFLPGAEFAGWITLKPLGKTDGKYGVLKMGSGLTSGQNDISYTVLGAYTSYEYKNFYANFEWGKANGYNGARGISSNKAEGLYTTLAYRITPKIQIVSRYDQYRPDLNISDNMQKEYSAGINYFIKGQAMKLMLNYVYCNNESKDDSHRIILGTQILL